MNPATTHKLNQAKAIFGVIMAVYGLYAAIQHLVQLNRDATLEEVI